LLEKLRPVQMLRVFLCPVPAGQSPCWIALGRVALIADGVPGVAVEMVQIGLPLLLPVCIARRRSSRAGKVDFAGCWFRNVLAIPLDVVRVRGMAPKELRELRVGPLALKAAIPTACGCRMLSDSIRRDDRPGMDVNSILAVLLRPPNWGGSATKRYSSSLGGRVRCSICSSKSHRMRCRPSADESRTRPRNL
jgi:hypothetical protein